MKEPKTWKSFDEQLQLLKSKGLLIENDERALHYLEMIGYYRLSGYWYIFREFDIEQSKAKNKAIRSEQFKSNSYFNDVISLYVFDKRLRLLALDALERIEMAVRTDIAYLLGEKHHLAYEEPSCLHSNFSVRPIKKGKNQGKTEHQLWLQKYEELVHRSRKLPFVAHNLEQYGKLPIGVASEVWDFGSLSRLFSGMKYQDKEMIAQKYQARSGDELAKWLKSLNFIRNVSAHHSRLWNTNILELSPEIPAWNTPNHKPYFYFCIMKKMLSVISPKSTWGVRFKALIESFPEARNQAFSLEDFGLPNDWHKAEI